MADDEADGRRRLESVDVLELAPVRRAEWRDDGGRVVVDRPGPQGRGLRRLGGLLSSWMSPRQLRLDDRGSFVWHRLDGRRTVGEIAAELQREHPDDEAVPERVGLFVRALRDQGLVAYPGWDDVQPPGGWTADRS